MHYRSNWNRAAGSRSIVFTAISTVAWLWLPLALPAQTTGVVERYQVERFEVNDLLRAAESGGPVALRALGVDYSLSLERCYVRSERFRAHAVNRDGRRRIHPPTARTFKGSIQGEASSMVRLSFTGDGLSGILKTSNRWIFIDPSPARGIAARGAGGEHMVFSDADLDPTFIARCRQELLPAGVPSNSPPPAGAAVSAGTALPILELAVDADFEYFQTHAGNTATQIEIILNALAGIFEIELGITVEMVSLNIWQDVNDPYTETDPLGLLIEFRNYWNATQSSIQRDAAHLFTGKALDNSTAGIAYVGVVCSTGNSYGLSRHLSSLALMPLLVAHEIGHNLGALHDDAFATPRYIMYPSLGSTNLDEFSDQSKQAISNYLGMVSCVEAPPGDPGGGSSLPPPTPPPGGGGGGGGPVDPILILVVLGYAAARRLAKRRVQR